MQVWHFSEMAYHPGWQELGDQLRNVIPSRVCDPKIAADLYHRYLDEWALCDELGLNIMVNEHHSTATCLSSACNIMQFTTRQLSSKTVNVFNEFLLITGELRHKIA